MGYGLIATPGGVDSHVHIASPALFPAALSGGVTTIITAGFVEPPWAMERALLGMDGWPLNIGLQAGARGEDDGAFDALLDAGACGFKIHEDYGAYPELIDRVLRFADANDVSVALHTDGLHESAELEDTVAAIAGRTVHAYHVEGTGGGHVPDLLGLVREANILCSSTTPTVPYGVNAGVEGWPMIILNHGASYAVASDRELVAERVHPATMAAEGPLHELGAIGIVNSDSQGMGRIMETVRRSIQLADAMRAWRATEAGQGHPGLPAGPPIRPIRPSASCATSPRPRSSQRSRTGSRRTSARWHRAGWPTSCSGSRPTSGSSPSSCSRAGSGPGPPSARGMPRSSAPSRRATRRTGAGPAGQAPPASLTFVSERGAADADLVRRLAAGGRTVVPVRNARGLTRADLVHNRATAPIEIDPVDGRVTLAGRPLASEAVTRGPAQPAVLVALNEATAPARSGRGLCCRPRRPGPAQGIPTRWRGIDHAYSSSDHGAAVIAAVAAACSSTGGGSAGASSPSAASSAAAALTGKTWQLTALTTKVPAFQGVDPGRRPGEVHDRVQVGRDVLRQGRLQPGLRGLHVHGVRRHDDHARTVDDGHVPPGIDGQPVRRRAVDGRELQDRDRRAHDHVVATRGRCSTS